MSLSRLQSSVPTLIGSSVRIFKERVASFATRFDILQKSNRFCKWRSKLFVFRFPKRCRFFTNRQSFLTCLRRCYRRRGRIMGAKKANVKRFSPVSPISPNTPMNFQETFLPVDRRPIVLTANASKHYKNAANSPTSYISLLSFTPRFSISPAVPLHYVPEKSADCGCFLSE